MQLTRISLFLIVFDAILWRLMMLWRGSHNLFSIFPNKPTTLGSSSFGIENCCVLCQVKINLNLNLNLNWKDWKDWKGWKGWKGWKDSGPSTLPAPDISNCFRSKSVQRKVQWPKLIKLSGSFKLISVNWYSYEYARDNFNGDMVQERFPHIYKGNPSKALLATLSGAH
jgi:hypothetical protein